MLAAERPSDLRQRACVSSLTRYMAICRGYDDLAFVGLLLQLRGCRLNFSATALTMESMVIRRSCPCDQMLQNLLRHRSVIGVPVTEE